MSVEKHKGFSIVELLAVIVITAVIAGIGLSRSFPSTTFQLQAARDLLLVSILQAQQRAMAQSADIALFTAGRQIDIRRDKNSDQQFDVDESETIAGSVYPIALPGGVSVSVERLHFDRLGHTRPTKLALSKGDKTLIVSISGAGYAH